MSSLSAHSSPADLVPGQPDDVDGLADELTGVAEVAAQSAGLLRAVEAGSWVGPSAEAFKAALGTMPQRLDDAADCYADASKALLDYTVKFRAPRREAVRAIALTVEADAATASWQVKAAASAKEAQESGQQSPFSGPIFPTATSLAGFASADPGEAIRARARAVLGAARTHLEEQGDRSAATLRAAEERAPDEPGFWDAVRHHAGEFFKGAGEAFYALGEFAWKMQPQYLLIDPKGYLEHKKGIADGLVYGVQNPKEFAKAVVDWDTWKESPARALGHLVPDLLLAAATYGTGTAGTAGTRSSAAAGKLDDLAAAGGKMDDLAAAAGKVDDLADAGRMIRPSPGDGARRSLYDQLMEPRVHPDNVDIVDLDRDPLGGLDPAAFADRYQVAPPGSPGTRAWDWPPDNGKVRGSETLVPVDDIPLDRIGGPDGTFFGQRGDAFHERSLPPDRLNFPRTDWEIDTARADAAGVQLERSSVAPWFEQPGGGTQYRFLDPAGKPLSQQDLTDLGVITGAP